MPQVLQVPLETSESRDSNYWYLSKHGHFTVRTCYYHILGIGGQADSSSSGSAYLSTVGESKWLWNLKLSTKIRTFLSKACNEILPVRFSLVHRRVGSDPYCPFCLTELETTSHHFF